jgi:hypothetical protein
MTPSQRRTPGVAVAAAKEREIAGGPSFERASRLAKALGRRGQKEIIAPTENDVQDMRSKIGDSPPFNRLSGANQDLLLYAIHTLRLKLQVYDDYPKMREEKPGTLLTATTKLIAATSTYGLMTVVADKMSKKIGITIDEAQVKINEAIETVRLMREIVQEAPARPKVYDKRTVRSRRQRDEAVTIRNCLKIFGISVRKTGPDEYLGKGNEELELIARIIHCTSGRKPGLHALRRRLTRAVRG